MFSRKRPQRVITLAAVLLVLVLQLAPDRNAHGFAPSTDWKKWVVGSNVIWRFGASAATNGFNWVGWNDALFPYPRPASEAVAQAVNDWNNHAGPGAARFHFNQAVPADSRTGVYSINSADFGWAGGWFESDGSGHMLWAQHFLNANHPRVSDPTDPPNGWGLAVKLMTHEFGHWLFLADTADGSPCPQQQRVAHPIMREIDNGRIDWDEQFGAQWLYGPYYMGFERGDADQNYRLYQTGGIWGDQAVMLDVPDGRGPDWIWDNRCAPAGFNGYKSYIIEGNLDGANDHRYIYYRVSQNGDPGLRLRDGMVLTWHQSNQEGYWMSVDAKLYKPGTGEKYLRDFFLRDQYGDIVHPATRQNRQGGWGNWVWYSVNLNQNQGYGNPIDGWYLQEIIVGYDHGYSQNRFRAYFDNINIYCQGGVFTCPE